MPRRRPGRAHLLLTPRRALLGLALVAVLGAAAPAGAAPGSAAPTAGIVGGARKAPRCEGVTGWSAYSGRPSTLAPLGTTGLYVWNERGVWRIAATHGDKRPQVFQGLVSFDAPVTRTAGVEGKSTIGTGGPGTVSFTFKNYGQVDGIALTASCATTVTVSGQVDGQPLSPSSIFLGTAAVSPSAAPAVLVRGTSPEQASAPASTLAAAATTAPVTTAACAAGTPWPAATSGRPPINRLRSAVGPATVFAWSDRNTWRLTVVGGPGAPPVLVEGRITASAPVTARLVGEGGQGRDGGGRGDNVRVDGSTVSFRVRGSGQVATIELGTGCAASLSFESLVIDGSPVAPGQLVVGGAATTPSTLPYAVTR